MLPQIEIRQGDLTVQAVDALVNPANCSGSMGGGVAGVLRRQGGEEIEQQAMALAPIHLGQAVTTTAGKLAARFIIHAPTMEAPTGYTDEKLVEQAVVAALKLSEINKLTSLALPGMGTGVGGLSFDLAACAIWRAILSLNFKSLKKLLLIDIAQPMVEAFRSCQPEKVDQ